MSHLRRQSGFTAVELLITLFVAAAFLIAGYQLFNVVIRDGGQARAESRAGNVAYDYLRRYSASATDPCTPKTPLNDSAADIDGLSSAKITVNITCPDYSTTSLSKVEVTITFNTPQQTVTYATFTNGLAAIPGDVRSGLVGQWKLNGNAKPSAGSANGVVHGATPTTGQNGQSNAAYVFDGVDDYIDLGNFDDVNTLTNNLTVSAWVKPASITGTKTVLAAALTNSTNGIRAAIANAGPLFSTWGVKDYTSTATSAFSANTWAFVTYVFSSNNVLFYVNGVAKDTVTHTTGGTSNTDDKLYIGATTSAGSSTLTNLFAGSLDDIRVYNRVLSATEISDLYQRGAQ